MNIRVSVCLSVVLGVGGAALGQSSPGTVTCPVVQPAAMNDGERALREGRAADAEAFFSGQVKSTPSADGFLGLIRSELSQGKVFEAVATAQSGTAAFPTSPALEAGLGDADLRAGLITEAAAAYSKAMTLDRCNAQAHFGAGRVYDLSSMHGKAQREFLIANRLNPAEHEYRLAYVLSLPEKQRLTGLRTLVAALPAGESAEREQLMRELAPLEGGATCTAVKPFGEAKLEMTALYSTGVQARDWGFRARVNGHKDELLEMDSSVSGLVLGRALAGKLGVRPLAGPGAAGGSLLGVVDSIRIGDLEYRKCPVRVVDDALLNQGNSLIGLNFFKDHLIHVDFAAREMTLKPYAERLAGAPGAANDAYAAPEQKTWWPVFIEGGRILMPTLINKKGPYLFLLDTGSPVVVMSPAVGRSTVGLTPDAFTDLEGTSGDFLKVYFRQRPSSMQGSITDAHGKAVALWQMKGLPIYRFAGVEHGDRYTFGIDLSGISRATGVEVAGLVGFSVLQDYFIDVDYRNGLVKLKFDQNHRYRTREDPATAYQQ